MVTAIPKGFTKESYIIFLEKSIANTKRQKIYNNRHKATINRIIESTENLIRSLKGEPQQPLSSISVVTGKKIVFPQALNNFGRDDPPQVQIVPTGVIKVLITRNDGSMSSLNIPESQLGTIRAGSNVSSVEIIERLEDVVINKDIILNVDLEDGISVDIDPLPDIIPRIDPTPEPISPPDQISEFEEDFEEKPRNNLGILALIGLVVL